MLDILKGVGAEYGPQAIQAATGCLKSPDTCTGTLKSLAVKALPEIASETLSCLLTPNKCPLDPQVAQQVAKTFAE